MSTRVTIHFQLVLTGDVRNLSTTLKSIGAFGDSYALMALANSCRAATDVPEPALDAARRTLLDTLGVSAAGSATAGGNASHAAAPTIWGSGSSSVWFSTTKLPPAGAAFVNATYAAALDLDDGHRGASGHPAAAIIPAVLAVGQTTNASPAQLLTAIVLGYEVAVRASAARDIANLRTTDTGLWCGLGVAAAAGWLAGHSTPVIAHAMAIAGQTSTSQAATGWTQLGHTVKEGIPWATANGLQAVALAASGHRGPLDLLDDPVAYDRAALIENFGRDWAIEQAYFKIYSCCRWAHAAIDGALILKSLMHVCDSEIESIVVETFDRALTLPNQSEPQSSEAAQYSIPFCVALALIHGPEALLPLKDDHLKDRSVTNLARRIRLTSADDYIGVFPAATPARVTMIANGRHETLEISLPKGEPKNPLSDADLKRKFERLASMGALTADVAQEIFDVVNRLRFHDATDLFAALGPRESCKLDALETAVVGD